MSPGIRVLSNLPLPSVDGYAIRTFGDYCPGGPDSAWRPQMERRDLADILPHIPRAEKPDILLISTPEYLPIPRDVAAFPGVRILLITDWNVCLRFLPDLCSLFNFCFTDWPGYRLLRRGGVANVHHQPLFGHDPALFGLRGTATRDLDVSFCGNLNQGLHGERNRLLARLARWGRDRRMHLSPAFGEAYVDVLNRSRLVFNHSIRGEANMRLFEAMACGAVPLVEASNQEAAILFQQGRHYFRFEPDTLERTLDALLEDPARVEAVALAAREVVGRHTKAAQIRNLLEFAGEGTARPASGSGSFLMPELGADFRGGPGTEPMREMPPSIASMKSLIKLRVLGAGHTLAESLSELQARAPELPGLDLETLPGCLLTLLEAHPGNPLPAAESLLDRFLAEGRIPQPLEGLLRMRLHALRGRWLESLDAARRCLETLEARAGDPDFGAGLCGWFHAPIELGKAANTDLNAAFREDMGTGYHRSYLGLAKAWAFSGMTRALLELGRPREALDCAQSIPQGRFASVEAHALVFRAYRDLGERDLLRRAVREWHEESPLDTEMWEKAVEALEAVGEKAALIGFLEDCLILAGRLFPPARAEAMRALLERARTKI